MDIAQVERAPRLFTQLLQAPARGLALFNPRKYNDEHESLCGGDVGDCGYMAEGQFHRLFNVFDPTPHPFPALSKPTIAPELRLNPRFPISTLSLTRFKISGNVANEWNPGLQVDVQFAISNETTSAAILIFAGNTHQVTQYMATDTLRDYILNHEKAIRQYFRHTIGTLTIIYGTTRTSGWFNDVRWLESSESRGQILLPNFLGISAAVNNIVTDINNAPIRVTAEGPAEDFDPASIIYTSVIRVVAIRTKDKAKHFYSRFKSSTRVGRRPSFPRDVNSNPGPTDLYGSGSHSDTPEQGSSTPPSETQIRDYVRQRSSIKVHATIRPPTEEELGQIKDSIAHGRDVDDSEWATYGPQNVLEEILDWILLCRSDIYVAIGDWTVINEYIEKFGKLPDETCYQEISIRYSERGLRADLVSIKSHPETPSQSKRAVAATAATSTKGKTVIRDEAPNSDNISATAARSTGPRGIRDVVPDSDNIPSASGASSVGPMTLDDEASDSEKIPTSPVVEVYSEASDSDEDFTTRIRNRGVLQLDRWLQRRGKHGVVRWVDRMEGSHHNPFWSTQVYVEERSCGTGRGSTKQAARDDAAWNALQSLRMRR